MYPWPQATALVVVLSPWHPVQRNLRKAVAFHCRAVDRQVAPVVRYAWPAAPVREDRALSFRLQDQSQPRTAALCRLPLAAAVALVAVCRLPLARPLRRVAHCSSAAVRARRVVASRWDQPTARQTARAVLCK